MVLVVVSLLHLFFSESPIKDFIVTYFCGDFNAGGPGISNVVYGLPLGVAVAHNGGAAVLTLVTLTHLYFIVLKRPPNES